MINLALWWEFWMRVWRSQPIITYDTSWEPPNTTAKLVGAFVGVVIAVLAMLTVRFAAWWARQHQQQDDAMRGLRKGEGDSCKHGVRKWKKCRPCAEEAFPETDYAALEAEHLGVPPHDGKPGTGIYAAPPRPVVPNICYMCNNSIQEPIWIEGANPGCGYWKCTTCLPRRPLDGEPLFVTHDGPNFIYSKDDPWVYGNSPGDLVGKTSWERKQLEPRFPGVNVHLDQSVLHCYHCEEYKTCRGPCVPTVNCFCPVCSQHPDKLKYPLPLADNRYTFDPAVWRDREIYIGTREPFKNWVRLKSSGGLYKVERCTLLWGRPQVYTISRDYTHLGKQWYEFPADSLEQAVPISDEPWKRTGCLAHPSMNVGLISTWKYTTESDRQLAAAWVRCGCLVPIL